MRYLTAQMVADAINRAPSPLFDAHDVEKSALRLHAVETAQEIAAQAGSGDALRAFSAVFARYVDRTFGGQLRKTSKVDSENLGGEVSQNQQWEKLVTHVAAPPSATNGRDAEIEEDDTEIQEDEQRRQAIHVVALRNAAGRAGEEP